VRTSVFSWKTIMGITPKGVWLFDDDRGTMEFWRYEGLWLKYEPWDEENRKMLDWPFA